MSAVVAVVVVFHVPGRPLCPSWLWHKSIPHWLRMWLTEAIFTVFSLHLFLSIDICVCVVVVTVIDESCLAYNTSHVHNIVHSEFLLSLALFALSLINGKTKRHEINWMETISRVVYFYILPPLRRMISFDVVDELYNLYRRISTTRSSLCVQTQTLHNLSSAVARRVCQHGDVVERYTLSAQKLNENGMETENCKGKRKKNEKFIWTIRACNERWWWWRVVYSYLMWCVQHIRFVSLLTILFAYYSKCNGQWTHASHLH